MAAFSYQHTPFLVDSVFLQNPPTNIKNMSGCIEEGLIVNTNNTHLTQICPSSTVNGITINDVNNNKVVEGSQLDQSSKVGTSDNETSVTKKLQSTESSMVVDKLDNGEQVTQKMTPFNKKRRNTTSGASINSAGSKGAREGKNKRQKMNKSEVNGAKNDPKVEEKDPRKLPSEKPPVGYIHVRARRGQATDSHSLAERVRREKISERMKILQHLVPGCAKVTGKALMLDEIINYVQSLQNQVEFLSMKLASVNPFFYELGLDTDAFMVRPERLSSIESPQPTMQHCNSTSPTTFFDANATAAAAAMVNTTTTFGTPNNQPLIDSSLLLLLQGQWPIDFSQDPAVLLWDLEEQRQKFLNPSCFSNNLSSFH